MMSRAGHGPLWREVRVPPTCGNIGEQDVRGARRMQHDTPGPGFRRRRKAAKSPLMLAAALTAFPAAVCAQATETRISQTYEGRLLIKVLDVRSDMAISGAQYRAGARVASAGVLNVVKPYTLVAQARGRRAAATVRPVDFTLTHGRKRRYLRFPAPGHPGAADPIAQLIGIAVRGPTASPCAGRLAFFDGKQRYDATFRAVGAGRLSEAQAQMRLSSPMRCQVTFQPISGFGGDKSGRRQPKSDIHVEFAPAPNLGYWVLSRVEIGTPVGAGRIELTGLRIETSSRRQSGKAAQR